MRLGAIVTGLLIATASPVLGQTAEDVNAVLDAIFGGHDKFETAFADLQEAVAIEDAGTVAALAAYPLVVKVEERREVTSAEEFAFGYDEIMTDEIVDAVAGQTYDTLFASDQGIMFGNGQVWMSGVCEDDDCAQWDVKIITIQSTAK